MSTSKDECDCIGNPKTTTTTTTTPIYSINQPFVVTMYGCWQEPLAPAPTTPLPEITIGSFVHDENNKRRKLQFEILEDMFEYLLEALEKKNYIIAKGLWKYISGELESYISGERESLLE